MAIPNNLIVVIQNEPRDGDIVYLEKDEEAFKKRLIDLGMVDEAVDSVELGWTYSNDDDFCTVIGHEVIVPEHFFKEE